MKQHRIRRLLAGGLGAATPPSLLNSQKRKSDGRIGSAWFPSVAAILLALCGASARAGADDAATAAWQAEALRQIAESEYQVSRQESTAERGARPWQAPNRAHGFRSYFLADGVRLEPRTGDAPSWQLELSPSRIGREGALIDIEAAESIGAEGSRVELVREAFVEWYVNDPNGLEQGFTIAAPPGRRSSTSPLLIEIAVSGSLVPRFSADGQAVDLYSARDGIVLRYAKLVVVDAAEEPLDAWMESFSRPGAAGIRIVIDDNSAVYPIVVDPLTTGTSWSDEGDQIGAEFGFSVATAGDVNDDGYSDVIVGARKYDNGESDEGCAFVYHGSASGLSLTADWEFDSDETNAELGFSVQTAGDVNGDGYSDVIVGCPKCDLGGLIEGRAFLFFGSASGLSASPDWSGDGDQGAMEYGDSVAAAGDVNGDGYGDVLVGAPFRDVSGTDNGRAYLYYGSASGITAASVEYFDGPLSFYKFGTSVAGVGDLDADGYADFAIGAPGADGQFVDEGEISVYLGDAAGPTQFSVPGPTDQTNARFGTSVGAAGDINGDGYADLIVGAPGYGSAGRAYVYNGQAGGIATTWSWTFEGAVTGMLFGQSVGTAGDVNGDGYGDVIVGAPDYTTDLVGPKGGAFVFLGSAGGLDSAPTWEIESTEYFGRYGESVATAGDINGDGYSDIVVGASQYDNPQAMEGRAFAYLGSAAGLSPASSWEAFGDLQQDQLGFAVASAGDVNGDGYSDVIVGAPNHDTMFSDAGHVRVYHGSPTGLGTTPNWDTNGDAQGDRLGYSVASAGDVNGDGYSDVIVGVPNLDAGANSDAGEVRVYYGSSLGLTSSIPDWTATGTELFAQLGISVASAGDVNGDGIGDIIIGEPFHSGTATDGGRAFVYQGSSGGLASSPAWSDSGIFNQGRFGWSVASAGDVNGDGFSDIIVGEPTACSSCGPGTAYVYLGTAGGVAGSPAWSDHGGSTATSSRFGWSVASAGDVNGDGYSDVVVGNTLVPSLNHVSVYYGSSSGLHVPADWQASGQSNSSGMGYSVGTAGDINGDGYADVFAGEPYYQGTQFDEGRLHLWLGSPSGLPMGQSSITTGNEADAHLGFSLASAGDIDGDGYADLIAGAPGAHVLSVEKGKALIYAGNGAEGTAVELLPRQLRTDGSGQVHHLGESDDPGAFVLSLFARTPYGRGRVRLQSEVKPLGTPFDGNAVQTPAGFTDNGGPAFPTLFELTNGLTPGQVYHWRVRLDYDSVTQPLAPAGRWLTIPLNGWQEADLRTNDGAVAGAGVVPDDPAHQLLLAKDAAGGLQLDWGDSCSADDDDFAIYSGTIGCFASHRVETCSTGGNRSYSLPIGTCDSSSPADACATMDTEPDPCRQYFLVVPLNSSEGRQGTAGFDSDGLPRSPGLDSCFPQGLGSCAVPMPQGG